MRIILRATGALALGLVALALVTMSVFSPSSTDADTGVNDPTPGSVDQVAVDMDTTGNPNGSGGLLSPIDPTSALPVGDTQEIDIIVDEVATADAMSGFEFNLRFNATVLEITSKNSNAFMLPGGFEIVPDPIPNDSGNLRMDVAQIGAMVTGEGVLVRFEIKCLADGSSPLDLGNDVQAATGGADIPGILDGVNFGAPIPVDNAVDGSIICGAGDPDTPTPTLTPPPGSPTDTPPPGSPTDTPTPTDEPTPTATDAPTPTATAVPTPTATSAPTTAAPTSAPASTATPGSLPPTGGSEGSSLSLPWTLWLMLAAGLFIASLGIAVITRSRARNGI